VAFNCGGESAVACFDSLLYEPDAEWRPGAAGGYLGGSVQSWDGTGLRHDGPVAERKLYKELRTGDHAYRFATEPGSYELTLRLVELFANGPEHWLVDIEAGGQPLISGLDLHHEVGKLRTFDLRRTVVATDTLFDVALSARADSVGLAGIALRPLALPPALRPPVSGVRDEPS